jgi:hypothetical protein
VGWPGGNWRLHGRWILGALGKVGRKFRMGHDLGVTPADEQRMSVLGGKATRMAIHGKPASFIASDHRTSVESFL